MPKFIEDDGILLPEFLFCSDNSKSRSDSPAATFNPADAIEGKGFEVTTSPSSQLTKKSIIIDKSSLDSYPELGERIALIKRLKIAGFKIFLRGGLDSKGNVFHEVGDDLENHHQLSTLTKFDEVSDYTALAEKGVARDKSLILGRSDKGQAKDVMRALTRTNYCGPISGNDFSCEIRNLEEFNFEKILREEEKNIDTGEVKFLEKLAFYLSRVSPEEAERKIKSFFSLVLDSPSKFNLPIINMAFFLVRALPSLENVLVVELKKYYKTHYLNLKNSIFKERLDEINSPEELLDQDLYYIIDSPEKLLVAVKILPDQEESLLKSYLDKISNDLPPKFYRKLVEMNNLFPHRKGEIIAKLKDLSQLGGEKFSCEILENLLSGKPFEVLSDEEFEKVNLQRDRQSHVYDQTFIEKKYDKLYAFLEASQEREDARKFFEKKILENASQDLGEYGYRDILRATLKRSPLMAEKILGLIQRDIAIMRQYRTHYLHSYEVIFIINAITNTLPEKTQELVEKYRLFHDVTPEQVYSLINHLPYEIRNRVLDIFYPILVRSLNEEDPFRSYTENPFSLQESDLESLHYSAESGEKSKPTYLNVADLGPDPESQLKRLKNEVTKGNFSTIKFGNNISEETISGFLDFLGEQNEQNEQSDLEWCEFSDSYRPPKLTGPELRCLRSVKHLIFPEKYREKLSETEAFKTLETLDVSREFFDDQNYLGIGDAVQRRAAAGAEQISTAAIESNTDTQPLETAKIRVAPSQLTAEMEVKDGDVDVEFTMISAGEVLNDPKIAHPQIRTAVIKDDILNNLSQQEYVPSVLEEIHGIKSLSNQDVEGFKTKDSANGVYYLFTQHLVANQTSRLLSADAAEDFVGLKGATGVKIEKGDDGFFYATSTSSRNLSYVTKAERPITHKHNYDDIPKDNVFRQIIDSYKDPAKGYLPAALKEKENVGYDASDHNGSMEKMFEERLGVCRHRVSAVIYQLKKKGIDPESFRAIKINGNHAALEIKYNGKWISVDLGGGLGRTIDAAADRVYTAAKLVKPETAPREKTLQDLLEDTSPKTHSEKLGLEPAVTAETEQKKSEKLGLEPAVTAETEQEQEQKEKLARNKMIQKLLAVSELYKVESKEDLKTKTVNSDKKKILIVTATDKIEQHGNFLLGEASSQERPTFYIDSPDKVDLFRLNLRIANDNIPILSKEGLLANFLENAKNYTEKKPLLVINWEAFSSSQRVALNTMLDQERKINGVIISDSIQIIGLAAASKDPSFLSRHDVSVKSEVDLQKIEPKNTTNVEEINLKGFPNWKRHLFGKVILQGEEMAWQKSDFVTALEDGKSNFEIKNLSPEAEAKLQYEFAQAKAVGKFTYHGHEIKLPKDFEIKCASNSFDFAQFKETTILRNVTRADAPSDCPQINSQLFDYLLCDKSISDDGFYKEEKGLIEKCSEEKGEDNTSYLSYGPLYYFWQLLYSCSKINSDDGSYQEEKGEDKTLKLFISSNLSDSQWYCLFDQAQQKDVKLEIHLAPRVEFPSQMKFKEWKVPVKAAEESMEDGKVADPSVSPKKTARIFVSNDPNQTLKKLKETEKNLFAVIDVEDFGYEDLVGKIDFEKDSRGFRNFKKTESELITRLKAGEKIVLKGEFSEYLLQMLEPILIGKEPEFAEIKDNLTLIIEDRSHERGEVFEPLRWLPKGGYEVDNHPKSDLPLSTKLYLEGSVSTDLDNSFEDSKTFITNRKTEFLKTLEESSMLRLVGHSGVGKSGLLNEFEDEKNIAIYRELTSFEAWAKQDKEGTKILFIDESNIEDLHFTMFSPLKEGGEKNIFYQGKFYPLDDRHKVVFACNPADYGGGRCEQKLFSDGKIPAIELRDFSASYIYEKILKDSIYKGLSSEFKEEISESQFKEICQPLITQYQEVNSEKKSDKDANEETVRELQEKVLKEILAQIDPVEFVDIKTENFISTKATKDVENALNTFLSIRQKQREGNFTDKAVGLNGFLLEGGSGVGKSVLIEALLKGRGITERKLEDEEESTEQKFYRISANLSLDKKKEIIARAFKEGNIVVIDELDSCIEDGLEKVLNAALTGDHPDPDGTKGTPKPGFGAIFTGNSASEEGRFLISPAMRHRCVAPRVPSLTEYSTDDVAKIIRSWKEETQEAIPDSAYQRIAENFRSLLNIKGGENLNLRMLKNSLPEFLLDYCALGELSEASAKKTDNNVFERSPKDESVDLTAVEKKPSVSVKASLFSPLRALKSFCSRH